MNPTDLTARHYGTGQPLKVVLSEGRIAAIENAASAPENLWLAPALVDLQVNGYGGVDFQQDQLITVDQLLFAARQLRADGCARCLLTLITDEWPKLTARLRHLRALRATSPELLHAVVGWHVEGPFLSEKPGFNGAHDPRLMLDPTPAHIRELREITGHDPLLLTLAPERKGAIDAIALAVSLGIKVSLGHTDASAETLRAAVQAGATGFTHLGNGCPRELDRHDNILWRVLETPGLTVSLIPDGHHVSPAPFRLIHRLLDAAAIYYTTDAMAAAASAGPGRFTLGKLTVEVGADQIVRQPGQTNFAGSALRPIDGVFRAADMLGCPWQETWKRFSEVPARWAGLTAGLAVGQEAPCCLLSFDNAERLDSLRVLEGGR